MWRHHQQVSRRYCDFLPHIPGVLSVSRPVFIVGEQLVWHIDLLITTSLPSIPHSHQLFAQDRMKRCEGTQRKRKKEGGMDSFKIKGIRQKEKQTKREKRERWRERKGLERHPSIMTDYCNSGCQEHRPVRLTPINSSVHYRAPRRHTDGRDCYERKTQAEPNNLSGLEGMADENRFPPLFSPPRRLRFVFWK